MQAIKNIIFDLGGIFMNIDYNLTRQAFINLGITDFDRMYTQHHANDLFEDLETGRIGPAEFYEKLRQITGTLLTDQQLQNAWNAMIMDFPTERLSWLEGIRQQYRVYLFSNTNQIHYEAFMEVLKRDNNCTSFDDYFIKAYYSHQMGVRKPYVESFQKILDEQQLLASETLFIDDTIKNVEGAALAGLQTIHLQSPTTVLDLKL